MMDQFSSRLITWYQTHKRDLPFRGTRDPYLIWVSEVIMQQTRMEQGLDYYQRFVKRFPDIFSLASAEEQTVLKIWQGLGYYSRARNLHETAKHLVETSGGKFPETFPELKKLKGIGSYSAASIASICFREAIPAIDGNVLRFLSRIAGFEEPVSSTALKNAVFHYAKSRMDRSDPGAFNQAMIEFGALVCIPGKPNCSECLFRLSCIARSEGRVSSLPVKAKKITIKKRYFHYIVVMKESDGKWYLAVNKRTANDIWRNLFDLPLIETSAQISPAQLIQTDQWRSFFPEQPAVLTGNSPEIKHPLSHQWIYTRFYQVDPRLNETRMFFFIPFDHWRDYPFPKLITSYLENISV